MKTATNILVVAGVLVLAIIFASKIGLVGFHYPQIVTNEPLRNPQKVRLEGTNIVLKSGTVIGLDTLTFEARGLWDTLAQSGFEVDLEERTGEAVAVFARQDGWICGTPWAQPIRIPLIPDTTYKNRRELIGFGYVLSNAPSGGPAKAEAIGFNH